MDQARKRADELRGQIALGKDPTEERAVLKQVPTLAQFVQKRYLPFIKGYKRSWNIDESLLRNHLLPVLGNRYLDQIKKDDIVALHQGRRANGFGQPPVDPHAVHFQSGPALGDAGRHQEPD